MWQHNGKYSTTKLPEICNKTPKEALIRPQDQLTSVTVIHYQCLGDQEVYILIYAKKPTAFSMIILSPQDTALRQDHGSTEAQKEEEEEVEEEEDKDNNKDRLKEKDKYNEKDKDNTLYEDKDNQNSMPMW